MAKWGFLIRNVLLVRLPWANGRYIGDQM